MRCKGQGQTGQPLKDAFVIEAIGASLQSASQGIQAVTANSSSSVLSAIKTAAAKTGVDFSYLMKKASQESGLNATAKSSNSSATGLFQFTSQTWLRMVKSSGAQYGLKDYASHITIDSTGTAHADASWKQAILNLRKDPTISAEMAGELDKQNLDSLKSSVGGKLGGTDLYLAHFLGASGASDFISAMRSDPNAKAANVLPEAAAANSSVFYTASGDAKSLKDIYQHFAQKFDGGSSAATLVASAVPATNAAGSLQVASATSSTTTPVLSAFSAAGATGNATSAAATSSVLGAVQAGQGSSLFATMILAQMNLDEKTSSSLFGHDDAAKHKAATESLTAAAA